MRILFTIPHYCKPRVDGGLGSERTRSDTRLKHFIECLSGLYYTLSPNQGFRGKQFEEANDALSAKLDVVVCTTGDDHLLDRVPRGFCRHHKTRATPRLLGYECHDVLRQALGHYDYYCYLEDDILLTDSLFFKKLAWFTDLAGPDAVLQPNRFEQSATPVAHRLYIDGAARSGTVNVALTPPEPVEISARSLGMDIRFEWAENPNAGCFFLNAEQMETWAAKPYFLDRSADFVGPIESAANLGLIRTFRVYKPALSNAAFLEVRHLDHYFLDVRGQAPVRRVVRPQPSDNG